MTDTLKGVYMNKKQTTITLLFLLLSAATGALRAGGWEKPVELLALDEKGGKALPWAIHGETNNIHAFYIRNIEKEKFILVAMKSSDNGAVWKSTATVPLGRFLVPPALLLTNDRMEGMFVDDYRKPYFQTLDLTTGEVTMSKPVGITDLPPIDDELLPSIIRSRNTLYYLFAEKSQESYRKLHLLSSEDGGNSWVKVFTPEWRHRHFRGGQPTMFATYAMLHVIFNEGNVVSRISHYLRPYSGMDWIKFPSSISKENSIPLHAAARNSEVLLLQGMPLTSDQLTLVLNRSADSGLTWSSPVQMQQEVLVFFSDLSRVVTCKSKLAYFGTRRVSPSQLSLNVRISQDNGKSWNDITPTETDEGMSLMPMGSFSADGSALYMLYLNAGEVNSSKPEGTPRLLVRRWTKE